MTHSIHDFGQRPAKFWTGYVSVALMFALLCLGLGRQAAFSADKDSKDN